MQNSELYRRGFVVPLNKSSEQAILDNVAEEDTEVQFYELPNEEIFEDLWKKGLFKSINEHLGSMIDDYEEEKIEAKNVYLLREVVRKFENSTVIDSQERKAVLELLGLCEIAIENNRPVFFIL